MKILVRNPFSMYFEKVQLFDLAELFLYSIPDGLEHWR